MSLPTIEELDARVDKGAGLMNDQDPGWFHSIDTIRLDLNSVDDCVLGQRFGDYHDGKAELGLDTDQAEAHGFIFKEVVSKGAYQTLTDRWLVKINDLLANV